MNSFIGKIVFLMLVFKLCYSATWTKSGKNIYYNEGKVGIGTSTPEYRLEVNGSFPIAEGAIDLVTSRTKASTLIHGAFNASSGIAIGNIRASSTTYMQNTNFNGTALWDISLNPYGGKVGIGTSTPQEIFSLGGKDEPLNFHLGYDQGLMSNSYYDVVESKPKYATDGTAYYVYFSNENGNDSRIRFLGAPVGLKNQPLTWNFLLTIKNDGNIGIGTDIPTEKLHVAGNAKLIGKLQVGGLSVPADYQMAVAGKAIFEGVTISLSNAWPDYVFDENYNLLPLKKVGEFIRENKHLPGVPSAHEVEKKGIEIGEMNAILVLKMEEMTLYALQQQSMIEKQQEQINELIKVIKKK